MFWISQRIEKRCYPSLDILTLRQMDAKYKVGYTTGVFDLFHIGHLNLLKNAKAMCEYLIVGVSTDELVEEYKGKKPIIPFEERCQIIEAIKYVDEVRPQISLDKLDALENISFDVMFHGSDWKGSELYNQIEKKFIERGVAIEFLPYTGGTSSTDIIKKIKLLMGKENY